MSDCTGRGGEVQSGSGTLPPMRWIDVYAIAASVATIVVTVFIVRVSRARGPSRGFGAA